MEPTPILPRRRRGPLCALAFVAGVVGCVPALSPTTIVPEPPAAEPTAVEPASSAPRAAGIHHVVVPGQTLWRIARAYGIGVAELAAANGIADPAAVEVGSALFVPGARAPIEVPPFPAPLPRPALREEPSAFPSESGLVWPIAGGTILSPYGAPRRSRRHAGIDIRGEPGQEILAARSGTVRFSGSKRGYGNVVIVDHGDGVETLYAHANALLVGAGDRVERGQPIARVGRTGNATTEHLHFEVRVAGAAVDPEPHLSGTLEARR